MFTAKLEDFKIKQDELQRQAENYRLAKSVSVTKAADSRILGVVGRIKVPSGSRGSRKVRMS